MADILTPEQVEAIRERHKRVSNSALPGLGVWCNGAEHRHLKSGYKWPCETVRLLADHDALTAWVDQLQESAEGARRVTRMEEARAEAAERKVAAVRAITDERHEDMPGHDELCEHDDWVWLEEVVDRLDRIAAVLDE